MYRLKNVLIPAPRNNLALNTAFPGIFELTGSREIITLVSTCFSPFLSCLVLFHTVKICSVSSHPALSRPASVFLCNNSRRWIWQRVGDWLGWLGWLGGWRFPHLYFYTHIKKGTFIPVYHRHIIIHVHYTPTTTLFDSLSPPSPSTVIIINPFSTVTVFHIHSGYCTAS